MSMIVCEFNLTSLNQTIYVVDEATSQVVPYTCNIDNIEEALGELARKHGTVKLYGNEGYITKFANNLKYNNKVNYHNYPVDIYINDNLME